jgi:hypothetical protein
VAFLFITGTGILLPADPDSLLSKNIFFFYIKIALIAATPASLTCTTSLEPGAVQWERQGAVATTQLVSTEIVLLFHFLANSKNREVFHSFGGDLHRETFLFCNVVEPEPEPQEP